MIAYKGFEKKFKLQGYQFKAIYGINETTGSKLQTEWIPLCGKSAGLSGPLSKLKKVHLFLL